MSREAGSDLLDKVGGDELLVKRRGQGGSQSNFAIGDLALDRTKPRVGQLTQHTLPLRITPFPQVGRHTEDVSVRERDARSPLRSE